MLQAFHNAYTVRHRHVQWRIQESGKEGAKPKGGGTWPGAHTAEGAECQNVFFRLRCWQPLPAENHLLHNAVAQEGIEGR